MRYDDSQIFDMSDEELEKIQNLSILGMNDYVINDRYNDLVNFKKVNLVFVMLDENGLNNLINLRFFIFC